MKLTTRQTAVLAALERSGESTLLDLRADFPELPPSAVLRVIEALMRKGLVSGYGDYERVYLGEVTFLVQPRGEAGFYVPV